ncbi:hypothetical protein VFMJ11_1522 [Aliivibrio fischeri MJ11]|uniref:Uncharacterized protein n=1 Tax=Aliivibrio fischeri (strain MJ11) TaxID=388396 RepID=B5FEH6_ALIFM|nr:hypothetical protein VFMJ11_1522 [Aliivibrio fischeri MJ11]
MNYHFKHFEKALSLVMYENIQKYVKNLCNQQNNQQHNF